MCIQGPEKYWRSHLIKHGFDYSTDILHKCISKAAIKAWGLFYSRLWSVSESKKWANLMDEAAGGGRQSEQVRRVISEKGRGRIPWNKNKHIWSDEEKKRIGEFTKLRGPQSVLTIQKRVAKLRGKKRTLVQCDNISKSLSGKPFTESHKKSLRGPRPHVVAHNRDKTKYYFCHQSGITEHCTRTDLIIKYSLTGQLLTKVILGDRKSHAGWKLKR